MLHASPPSTPGTPKNPLALAAAAAAFGAAEPAPAPTSRPSQMVQAPLFAPPQRRSSGSCPPGLQAGLPAPVNGAGSVVAAVHQPQLPSSPLTLPRAGSFSHSRTGSLGGSLGVQRLTSSPNLSSSGTRTPGTTPTFAARQMASVAMSPQGTLQPTNVASPRLVSPGAPARAVPGGVLPTPATLQSFGQGASCGSTPTQVARNSPRSASCDRPGAFVSPSGQSIPGQPIRASSAIGPRRTSALVHVPVTEVANRSPPPLQVKGPCLTPRASLPPGAPPFAQGAVITPMVGPARTLNRSLTPRSSVLSCPATSDSLRPSSVGTSNRSSLVSLHGSTASLQPEGPRILTQISSYQSHILSADTKVRYGTVPVEASRPLSDMLQAEAPRAGVQRSSSFGADSTVVVVPSAGSTAIPLRVNAPVSVAPPPVDSSVGGATSSTMSLTGYLMGSSSCGDGTPRVRIDFGEEACDVAVLPFCAFPPREPPASVTPPIVLESTSMAEPVSSEPDKTAALCPHDTATEMDSNTIEQSDTGASRSQMTVEFGMEASPEDHAKATEMDSNSLELSETGVNRSHMTVELGVEADGSAICSLPMQQVVPLPCESQNSHHRTDEFLDQADGNSEAPVNEHELIKEEGTDHGIDAHDGHNPELHEFKVPSTLPRPDAPRSELDRVLSPRRRDIDQRAELFEGGAEPGAKAASAKPASPAAAAPDESDVFRSQAPQSAPATSSPEIASRGPASASLAAATVCEIPTSRPPSPLCTKIRLYEFAKFGFGNGHLRLRSAVPSPASAGPLKTPAPGKSGHVATPSRARTTRAGSGAAIKRSPRAAAERRANSRGATVTDSKHSAEAPGLSSAKAGRSSGGGNHRAPTTRQPTPTAEAKARLTAASQRFQRVRSAEEPAEEPVGSGTDAAGVIYLF